MNNFKSVEFNAGIMYSIIESKMKLLLPKDSTYNEVDVEITIPKVQMLPTGHSDLSHSDIINFTCKLARLQFEDVYGQRFELGWKRFQPKSPHGKQYITMECTIRRKNIISQSCPISLSEFLKHKTEVKELCVIREDGWIVATFWIDYEDLFMRYIDNKIGSKPVKKDEWGWLPIVNEDNGNMEVRCHYIDI